MALVILPQPINVAFGTFFFFMGDADKTVRVDLSKDLLARLEGPPLYDKKGYVDRLIRHQYLFAHIAARKYLQGDCALEACVFVVRITTPRA